MLSSNWAICGSKNSRLIKEQEASVIIISSAKLLSKILLIINVSRYQMNETVNNILLVTDKSMPEMYLRQAAAMGKQRFVYSACGSFTKNKECIQKSKEAGYSRHIYQN